MTQDMRRLIGITTGQLNESAEPVVESPLVAAGLVSVPLSALVKIVELFFKDRKRQYIKIDGQQIAEMFFLPLNVAMRIADYLNARKGDAAEELAERSQPGASHDDDHHDRHLERVAQAHDAKGTKANQEKVAKGKQGWRNQGPQSPKKKGDEARFHQGAADAARALKSPDKK